LLFYPSLGYAYMEWNAIRIDECSDAGLEEEVGRGRGTEREPLLS
jgi:hypothetical protein